ncbi:MAG: InlB B-repeat-containing protein, partial [Alphaproteobacteria bacterium]|nr:InlB B-repeat-containing protein [Alphaproteobacteria bacterium]
YLSWEPNNGETINPPNMCTWGGSMTGIQHPTKTGYTFIGWYLKRCEIPSTDVSNNGNARASKRLSNGGVLAIGATAETYGLEQPGEWGVSWSNGDKVTGVALCSQTSGTYPNTGTPDETGSGETQYCWCKATHYTANNAQQCSLVSPAWVFYGDFGSNCALFCPDNCAGTAEITSGFRAALFGENVATP